MLQRVFFGTIFEKWNKIKDLSPHEVVVLASLTLAIVIFGVYPSGLTDYFIQTANILIRNI